MKTRVIPASKAREGMVMVFANERFNYAIEEVTMTRDGEVRITSRNDTAVEWFKANVNIWIRDAQ